MLMSLANDIKHQVIPTPKQHPHHTTGTPTHAETPDTHTHSTHSQTLRSLALFDARGALALERVYVWCAGWAGGRVCRVPYVGACVVCSVGVAPTAHGWRVVSLSAPPGSSPSRRDQAQGRVQRVSTSLLVPAPVRTEVEARPRLPEPEWR